MNQRQKQFLWAGAIIVSIMIVFPPWQTVRKRAAYSQTYDSGYSFIGKPSGNVLDLRRLGLQIGLVVILTGAGLATARGDGAKPFRDSSKS